MAKKSDDHIALGRAIRELRATKGLSQEALAAKAGMHRTYLGGIERGERNVAFANILLIADALQVRASELLDLFERIGDGKPGRR